MLNITIRKIQPTDNSHLATIVRSALAEFGANKSGTVFYDETTDHLCELFQEPGSMYYVAEQEGQILGGGGIYPSKVYPREHVNW